MIAPGAGGLLEGIGTGSIAMTGRKPAPRTVTVTPTEEQAAFVDAFARRAAIRPAGVP
ncbi:hypothetical protein C882_4572 [Caenispirillum salinarum AK4]|uniref:Uncharacterized protein n=1 Tax=Caenispirillum salinarum AK4 TaxID=1238182 RepID=K9GY55_9PROT|nr:hypothetical protein C882_4572 [Caenispirillum salinarum AK4]